MVVDVPVVDAPIRRVIINNFDYSTRKNTVVVFPPEVVELYSIKEKFEEFKSKWLGDVMFYSNPQAITSNVHYKNIIDLGVKAVPFILADLRINRNDWFSALKQILHVDPVKQEHYGDINAMTNDWMSWYDQKIGN